MQTKAKSIRVPEELWDDIRVDLIRKKESGGMSGLIVRLLNEYWDKRNDQDDDNGSVV